MLYDLLLNGLVVSHTIAVISGIVIGIIIGKFVIK